NETNRSMSALNFDRDVRISDTVTGKVGITRVSFNWTNFAYRKDGNLVMGDVFVGSGLTIGSNEKLVVEYDRNLSLETVVPQPDTRDSNSLQWTGQRFFEAGHPRVVLSLPDTSSVSIPPFLISVVAGVVVLISGFFGGVYIGRRFGIINGSNASASESEADGGSVETEDELLTDEDRIVNLLRENEGRMKQADIVESTGWSKSKVSMVLSDMEDDGKISKLRLGRENVIDLADGDGEE
ncbi:MAG: winged helix-turn-helix transcriptional regulator, partial [Halobacteria archaeon]|nr:winged helix-turn-helix transcriptional regulator [Halobacteria archaeon]